MCMLLLGSNDQVSLSVLVCNTSYNVMRAECSMSINPCSILLVELIATRNTIYVVMLD